jgi:hypothetical protein
VINNATLLANVFVGFGMVDPQQPVVIVSEGRVYYEILR